MGRECENVLKRRCWKQFILTRPAWYTYTTVYILSMKISTLVLSLTIDGRKVKSTQGGRSTSCSKIASQTGAFRAVGSTNSACRAQLLTLLHCFGNPSRLLILHSLRNVSQHTQDRQNLIFPKREGCRSRLASFCTVCANEPKGAPGKKPSNTQRCQHQSARADALTGEPLNSKTCLAVRP